MSHTDCTINADFHVKSTLKLPDVLPLFVDFLNRYKPDFIAEDTAFMDDTLSGMSSHIELVHGRLIFVFNCYSMGQGFAPEGLDALVAELDKIAIDGGALELFNEDTPANSDETCIVYPLGPNPLIKKLSMVRYGLEKTREFLEPVIGKAAFMQIYHQAIAAIPPEEIASIDSSALEPLAPLALPKPPVDLINNRYPEDSDAAQVFGQTQDKMIALSGPSTVLDGRGNLWGIDAVDMVAEGFTPDVYVHLSKGEPFKSRDALKAVLAGDEVFISNVMKKLSKVGYQGESLSSCERGMQGRHCVMLEPTEDFRAFALVKGFVPDTSWDTSPT